MQQYIKSMKIRCCGIKIFQFKMLVSNFSKSGIFVYFYIQFLFIFVESVKQPQMTRNSENEVASDNININKYAFY